MVVIDPSITAPESVRAAPSPARPVKRPFKFGRWFRDTGWRHLVAVVMVIFAVFPLLYVLSASFNPGGSLVGSNAPFTKIDLQNYVKLFTNPDQPFALWFLNTIVIGTVTSVCTVFLGALTAYAFSRMRFCGRRAGLLSLMLIQMFPQYLAVVAIFLLLSAISDVFPILGLGSQLGLILVYLGGALGVNTYLMYGFFSTVPVSIDEAAKLDGASHVQIFFTIILRLVAPILAVVGLLSFIATTGEYVIASIVLTEPTTQTLAVGLYSFVSQAFSNNWSIFAAGAVLAAIPVMAVFLALQKYIVGGLTAGSALYVSTPTPVLGETVRVRLRVPESFGPALAVHTRSNPDREPQYAVATPVANVDGWEWWEAELRVENPVHGYRWLLSLADGSSAWVNATGVHTIERVDSEDFRLVTYPAAPGWASSTVMHQIFPDRFARSAAASARELPDWAEPAEWTDDVIYIGADTPRQLYGGDLAGIAEHLDHLVALGVNLIYLTPVFPAQSNHRLDALSFAEVDPLLGGDEALVALIQAAHGRGLRVIGDLTSNHSGDAHEWFRASHLTPGAAESEFYYWLDAQQERYVSWLGVPSLPKFNWNSAELRRRFIDGPDSVVAKWLGEPYNLDGWRIDVSNMTGRHLDQDLNQEVRRTIRRTMVETKTDTILLGESTNDAASDFPGDAWHGAMTYANVTRPGGRGSPSPGVWPPVESVWHSARSPRIRERMCTRPISASPPRSRGG